MSEYEDRRAKRIARNRALLKELQLETAGQDVGSRSRRSVQPPAAKRRKVSAVPPTQPLRSSARLASASSRTSSKDSAGPERALPKTRQQSTKPPAQRSSSPPPDLARLRAQWRSWTASAPAPTRDSSGTFHFPSHPSFQPNKSPSEMLHEGVFGGAYFGPVYSARLRAALPDDDDWAELPAAWRAGLRPPRAAYAPDANKYRVACGQSIEAWEAAGWINHVHDPRGWFQWYCRFFQGRRCDDDDRQVRRWERCVGERGRWRAALRKSYLKAGIKEVNDEGLDDAEVLSPAVHQTCLHWAWELRQDVLDRWWREG